jgi:hypothetical protein
VGQFIRPSPAPSDNSDSDNDDDGAPVAIPHTQAKRAVKSREAAREAVEAGERERRKERNRERDRRAKARKGTVEEEDVESRMERAMREAQEEADEDGDTDDSDPDDAQMSGGEGSQDDSDSEDGSDIDADADEHMSPNPNHLPEHLFASAFASSSPAAASTAKTEKPLPAHKKRKRSGLGVKDLVVGCVFPPSPPMHQLTNSHRTQLPHPPPLRPQRSPAHPRDAPLAQDPQVHRPCACAERCGSARSEDVVAIAWYVLSLSPSGQRFLLSYTLHPIPYSTSSPPTNFLLFFPALPRPLISGRIVFPLPVFPLFPLFVCTPYSLPAS